MATLVKQYDYYMYTMADKRVENWPLMSSPLPMLAIVGLYLYAIYGYLPAFMKNRKPYNLKKVLAFYNAFQVIACCILIYGISTSGWTTHYTLGCQPVDYSENKLAIRMLNFVWWTMMLKLVELIETVFFILRKKYNQVSKLHVYHHASTFILAWFGTKYMGGGMATFPIIINSFVHVLMYVYYFLALFGPKMQKSLAKWKPRLTMLQMIQFCILLLHGTQALKTDCNVPKKVLFIWFPNVFTIFYMFYEFYRNTYTKQQKGL